MVMNSSLKRILSMTIFKLISKINNIFPKNDKMVMFYSNLGFRDNISYLYNYMIENGYNQKYKIIISTNEKKKIKTPSNVKVVSNIRGIFYFLLSNHIFYTFGKLPIRPVKNQKVVQTWHGSPFKNGDKRLAFDKKYIEEEYYTNFLSTSTIFTEAFTEIFNCKKEIITICGHPRTDVMINPYNKNVLGSAYEKYIIWLPTFRQSKILGYDETGFHGQMLPCVQNEELDNLDAFLEKYQTKLIIKLHPMQTTDKFTINKYNNIEFMTQDMFKKSKLDLYRILGTVDALITDYSSVFYDFMLMDKPIAFTSDDFEEYKCNRGFAFSNPDDYRCGEKIYNLNDLKSFIKDVYEDVDNWKDYRNQLNSIINIYDDFENCKRALEIGGVIK